MQHSALRKSATAKNTNFALEGYNRFTKPSWVRAHVPIFGESYIVWVCAPPYSPLSSPKSRIRENSALKFGPNFVIHSGGIFYPVVFFNPRPASQYQNGSPASQPTTPQINQCRRKRAMSSKNEPKSSTTPGPEPRPSTREYHKAHSTNPRATWDDLKSFEMFFLMCF